MAIVLPGKSRENSEVDALNCVGFCCALKCTMSKAYGSYSAASFSRYYSNFLAHQGIVLPKYKFPSPDNCKRGDPMVMIDAEEVLVIYNQDHPDKPAKRIATKVKDHMDHLSQKAGWAGTAHVKNAKTGHGAGLLLLAPQHTVNVNLLVLPEGQGASRAKKRAIEDITDI